MKTTLSGFLFTALMIASTVYADDRGSACVFSKEPKASLYIDPWAKAGTRLQRFGTVENGDDVTIQNCKGVNDQFLALVIGNRESSLASDSGNVVITPQLGIERCDFTKGIKSIPWLVTQVQRENAIRSRIKTLRSCVALQVASMNGRPLILGNHPSCKWTAIGPGSYVARGAVCTVKIETTTALSVKPIVEESCLEPSRFESRELQSGDFNTALQAFVTSDAAATSTNSMVGVSSRRIVFAPSPTIAAFDEESPLRFPKTINLKVQPVALDLATQRTKEDATSFVTMQLLVRNVGSVSSSFPVPLAAEAQLFEISKGGEASSITTWTAYASGQTLVPADWSGLFITDRAEVSDFAFRHGRRYRIRLKYFHPHDVPGILQAELRNRPQNFALNVGSFDIAKFPLFNLVNSVPSFGTFPTLGRGPQETQTGSQVSASEREILQFFRQLGVDDVFPVRYVNACDGRDDNNCVSISNSTYIGQSIIEFTADSTPGQASELRAISLSSHTKMNTDTSPSSVYFEDREGIKCN